MLRAVTDTNVFVSAVLTPGGTCDQLVTALLTHRWRLVASPMLLDELTRVLLRPKLAGQIDRRGATPAVLVEARLVTQLADLAELVDDPEVRPAVTRDPDDDYLIALAQAAGVDALVAGDKDLLTSQQPTVPVLTPRTFLGMLSATAAL